MSKPKRKKRHVLRNVLIILIIILALCYAYNQAHLDENISMPEDVSFEVYFIDVGQGDSAFIVCDGRAMLIDGGSNEQSQKVYSFLESRGIKHLDYIVASHADADHVGGLSAALNYAKVDHALCTVTSHETVSFTNFVKYLKRQGVEITVPDAGDTFSLGSAQCTVIGPEKGETYSDNTSLIIRVEYGNTSFLFTGDAEYSDEQAALESGLELKSTVLKVGHHGSSSSSSYYFLQAVQPRYAVISVAADNDYGHPTERVLGRLDEVNAEVLRTDELGDILCRSDGENVKFTALKNEG